MKVEARLGNNSIVSSTTLTVKSESIDDVRAQTEAVSGGLVGVAGATSFLLNNLGTLVTIGDNVEVDARTVILRSDHEQNFDTQADALAFGLGAGTGATGLNIINSKANVDIGEDSKITAFNIDIDAKNNLRKDIFSTNLSAGTFGGLSISVLTSKTDIGTNAAPSEAIVDIGRGTEITALGGNT